MTQQGDNSREEKIAELRDAALKRALTTPHIPAKKLKGRSLKSENRASPKSRAT